jgi:hypothetical protein
MKYKIAVITSVCGLEVSVKDPAIAFDGVDYFAFVDKPHNFKVWKEIKSLDFSTDQKYKGRRNAKIYKVLPQMFLPDYDYWFWVDSTHELIMNPIEVIENYLVDSEIGLWNHTTRNCVYDESNIVNQLGYDHSHLLDSQVNFYKSEGYPSNNGLYELPVSIRKNTEDRKSVV